MRDRRQQATEKRLQVSAKNNTSVSKRVEAELAKISPNDFKIGPEAITEEDLEVIKKVASGSSNQVALPVELLARFNCCIIPKFKGKKTELDKESSSQDYFDVVNHFGLETKTWLHLSVDNGGMAMDVADKLIKEYDCRSASEKATAQIVANAFVRVLEISKIFKRVRNSERMNKLHIDYLSVLSKELDRANKQYESALNALIRIKSPSFQIKVTARNAFLAKNQQFNANQSEQ